MSSTDLRVPYLDLLALEERVKRALAQGEDAALNVLGYGEVTLVLALDTPRGRFACKRLPQLADDAQLASYRAVLEEYLLRLRAKEVPVAPTRLWWTHGDDGTVTAYVVQPCLPADGLVSRVLRDVDGKTAEQLFDRIATYVEGAVSEATGLDAQASNWIIMDGALSYLDVSTPLLRDEAGRERLDVRPFFASLPRTLRGPARVAMGPAIFDKFYSVRGALVDLLGNLHKERLAHLVPRFLPRANAKLVAPISEEEVSLYYRSDAQMWAVLQRLRRADRWWQRNVRRRPYPFLLPGAIAR